MLRFHEISHKKTGRNILELTFEEYGAAEIRLIRIVQSECFNKKGEYINMQIFQDEKGLLRVKTKLARSEENDSFKFPILMPYKHEVVKRLIVGQHKISLHAVVQPLLGKLREIFWIVKGINMVKDIISEGVICERGELRLETCIIDQGNLAWNHNNVDSTTGHFVTFVLIDKNAEERRLENWEISVQMNDRKISTSGVDSQIRGTSSMSQKRLKDVSRGGSHEQCNKFNELEPGSILL
ncbi:hypothetical protein JTB14_005644 [Gonioctena quinquepunctata]|nr:hypothetical protein JTB14_005644 [Gonioctena quinquepunctata]